MDPYGRVQGHSKSYYILSLGVATLAVYPIYLAVLWIIGQHAPRPWTDFSAYWHAGYRAWHGYPLYTVSSEIPELASFNHGHNQYLYPPLIAVLFIPFSFFNLQVSTVFWLVFTGIVYLWSIRYLLVSVVPGISIRRQWVVLGLSICFWPIKIGFYYGQITPLLIASLSLSGGLLIRPSSSSRSFLTGVAAVLPAVIKPVYLPANAHLLRDWRRLAGGFVTVIVFVGVSVAIFGLDPHFTYIDYILDGGEGGIEPAFGSVDEWTNSAFAPFYVVSDYAMPIRGLLIAFTVAVSIYSHRTSSRYTDRYVFCIGLILVPLATPFPDLLILSSLVPVIILTIGTEWQRSDGRLVIPATALVLLQVHKLFIEIIVQFGPRYLPRIDLVFSVLPGLQPALWALVCLFGLSLYRIVQPSVHSHPESVVESG